MTLSHVAVTPGAGVLVRRDTALLFDPTGTNTELVAAFDRARDDQAAVRSSKDLAISSGFEIMPFVVISWDYRLQLLVLGDVALHSSAPSVPMISGASSTSWVEHHIAPQDFARHTSTSVWCGDEVDPVTDLRRGVASCGGIKVTLQPERVVAFAPAGVPVPVIAPEVELPTMIAASPPAPAPEPQVVPEQQVAEAQAPEQHAPKPAVVPVTPAAQASPGLVMPQALLAALPRPTPSAPTAPVAVPAIPTPTTAPLSQRSTPQSQSVPAALPEPAVANFATDILSAPTPSPTPAPAPSPTPAPETPVPASDEQAVCENGHDNPPSSSACFTCGAMIGSDPDRVRQQAGVGEIVFPEGTVVPIEGPVVLGSRPVDLDDHTLPITVHHPEVDGKHARIELEGWAVLLTDLGSVKGTFIFPPGAPQPVQLQANTPHALETGTTVQLGAADASFTYRSAPGYYGSD